jgi:hypothetical protein
LLSSSLLPTSCRSRNIMMKLFLSSSSSSNSSNSNSNSRNTIQNISRLSYPKAAAAAAAAAAVVQSGMVCRPRLQYQPQKNATRYASPYQNCAFTHSALKATSNRRQSGFLVSSAPFHSHSMPDTADLGSGGSSSSSKFAAPSAASLPLMQQSLLLRAGHTTMTSGSKDCVPMRSLFSLRDSAASGLGASGGPIAPGSSFICVGVCPSRVAVWMHAFSINIASFQHCCSLTQRTGEGQ